jgi:Domain of unknown function (DUF4377)
MSRFLSMPIPILPLMFVACTERLTPAGASVAAAQVRELHCDAKGLRSGTPGAWQLFHDTIEGYTHEEGVRNVVRIKRFPIANPPMAAPATGDVLDMVIESQTVDP